MPPNNTLKTTDISYLLTILIITASEPSGVPYSCLVKYHIFFASLNIGFGEKS